MTILSRKFKVVFGAAWVLLCMLGVSHGAFGQALPDGKGKTEFVHNCTACHRADMVTRVKKTPDDWRKSVIEMASRGTDGTKEDLENVILYLDTYYAADKSGAAAAPSASPISGPASPALDRPAVPNSADSDHVKQLIADNGCLTCHRVEQRGSYTGPTLNGVGTRRTPVEIRAAIVSPHPTVEPGNNIARLTTADGKTVLGRVLSQDDHQMRVIDALGEVATYSKTEVRQLTIIDTNPMPSYERKIMGEDLDGLVRYLNSLPVVEDGVRK